MFKIDFQNKRFSSVVNCPIHMCVSASIPSLLLRRFAIQSLYYDDLELILLFFFFFISDRWTWKTCTILCVSAFTHGTFDQDWEKTCIWIPLNASNSKQFECNYRRRRKKTAYRTPIRCIHRRHFLMDFITCNCIV